MARVLDDGELHAEADAEERYLLLAGVADRLDLALGAAIAEAAGDEDRVEAGQHLRRAVGAARLDLLGVDVLEVDAHVVVEAAVDERLVQRFVRVPQVDVLADDADLHGAARRLLEAVHDALPRRQIRLAGPDVEALRDLLVDALGVERERQLVDARHVHRGDDAVHRDVGEERDLLLHRVGEGAIAAAQQDVGLDADLPHLLDGVLRRLGLELAGRRDEGDERHVDAHGVLVAEIHLELADRFEEGERLDVADGAADLDDRDVDALGRGADARLDLVGDVRDDLHRRAQVLAAPLLGDDGLVHAAGGEVVLPRHAGGGEPLVVAEVEIRLGAVVRDEDLAVLVRAHRARIHVDVRVELDVGDLEAAGLHQRADRRGREAFADRRNNPARHEHEFGPLAHDLALQLRPALIARRKNASRGKPRRRQRSNRSARCRPHADPLGSSTRPSWEQSI